MAQWNLSVDLRGQGASLSRSLRNNARHARTLATNVQDARGRLRQLRDTSTTTTAALDHLASQTNTSAQRLRRLGNRANDARRDLRRLADQARITEEQLRQLDTDITIQVRLDDQTGGAELALRQVQEAARDTADALRTLRRRAEAVSSSFDELRNQALLAAGGIRSLSTAARTADGRLNTLSERTRTLNTNMGELNGTLGHVTGHMGNLGGSIGSTSSAMGNANRQSSQLLVLAGMLGTALLPIAASLVPIAAGLTAAAAGAGVFGIAIAGQIKGLVEAAEAQTAYDEAVREHGRSSPEAAKAELAQLAILKELPAATREGAAAYEVLTDDYKAWSNALAGDTMPVATKGMAIFSSLLGKTTPLAKGASREMSRFMTILAGSMETGAFNEFMEDFTVFAVETLARANAGVVRLARGLDSGEIGGNVREFLAYARENGPLVADTLSELFSALMKLVAAASDAGVGMLTVVNAFGQLINAIPTEVLSTLLQVAFAFKAIQLAGLAMGVVGPVMGTMATNTSRFVRAARFGGVASAIAGVTQQLSAMQKASIVLAVLTVAVMAINELAEEAKGAPPDLDKLTTSLKELGKAGQFTGELQKTFGDMKGFVRSVNQLKGATKGLEDGMKVFDFMPSIVGTEKLLGKIDDLINGPESISALTEKFHVLDEGLASLATSGHTELAADRFKMFQDALKASGRTTEEIAQIFPEYQAAIEGLKAEQELAAKSMGVFGEQAQATKAKLDAQKASADGLRASIQALNETNRAALGGQIAFEQAIDDTAKAAKENADALEMTDGVLDLNSEKARAGASALQDLATKTDEAASAARESGASWETVNGIYKRGQDQFMTAARAMGLTAGQAAILREQMLLIPDVKKSRVDMDREDALTGLDQVIAKIEATPGSKSVTVSALTGSAMTLLHNLGYKTETLPDGQVKVTAYTGTALAGIGAVQAARDRLSDRSITITTTYLKRTVYDTDGNGIPNMVQAPQARGSVLDFYANGGLREDHVAQIAPAGAMRVWAEQETGGEAYVPLSPSKRPRSRRIAEETVRRLGGDPAAIEWHANGGVTDWRYDPSTGSLYSPSDAGSAGNRTKKVKGKDVSYFDLGQVERSLRSNSRATQAWNRDLEKVADRVGGDVAEALAAMGKDGVALTKKMANGSTKYINEMAASLRGLAATAKASLSDYTRSLNGAISGDDRFQQNLVTLAARGHGDLARQLGTQGDQAAIDLAAAAVRDNGKAGAANSAAKRANSQLTGEQVQQLLAIIAAISTAKTGIHDVAGKTGLGEDDIIDTAGRASGQIKKALGSRATKFLADLGRAGKGLSYANGGIREGIYATRGGAVTFAEPSTGGEAFIPLGQNKRSQALPVLREAAARMGVGVTDLSQRQVVVVPSGGDTFNLSVPAVRTGASAHEISAALEWQMRRARRGGVAARA
ncbi:hypothetical protein [Streptomyces sp. NBC_01353]|uniref:hypothetical protein n=1 Tax=Streptomyces sp. NBC_01353 TaxID=2903835 RepID=UPI002E2F4071|nr:hypothetical protein [Streptomyces sp. NBC_01353]